MRQANVGTTIMAPEPGAEARSVSLRAAAPLPAWRRLPALAGCILLAGCATGPAGARIAIPTHMHSDDDFRLTRPAFTLSGGALVMEGAFCRRFNSTAMSPGRLLITGYNAKGERLFRRTQRISPLNPRTDDTCHYYTADLPATPAPSLIDARLIPYGGSAPP